MARIQLADLPPEEALSPEELEQLFGAGPRKYARLGIEGLESRELYATSVLSTAVPILTQPALVTSAAPVQTTWAKADVSAKIVDAHILVGTNADGSRQAYAVGSDGKAYTNTTLTATGAWALSGWQALTSMTNPPALTQLALTTDRAGNSEPYGLGTDGTVYELTTSREASGAFWTRIASPPGGASAISVFTQPNGVKTLYALSKSDHFIHVESQSAPGDWSGASWQNIEQDNAPRQEMVAFSVAADPQGNPLVFAITAVDKGNVIVNSVEVFAVVQDPANKVPYGQWVNIHLDTATAQQALSLSVAASSSGALTVCVLANDGHVYETTFAPGQRPSSAAWQQSWTDLTSSATGVPAMKSVTAVYDSSGTLEVLALGKNNQAYQLRWVMSGPNAQALPTTWQNLGAITYTAAGAKSATTVTLSNAALATLADGSLQALLTGTDSHGADLGAWTTDEAIAGGVANTVPFSVTDLAVEHLAFQTATLQAATTTKGQTAWASVGADSEVVVGINANGVRQAYALGLDGRAYTNTTLTSTGAWATTGWQAVTAMTTPPTLTKIVLTTDANGNSEPYGLDAGGNIYELTTTRESSGPFWTKIALVSGGAADISVFTQTNGVKTLYALSKSNELLSLESQSKTGDWSGAVWHNIEQDNAPRQPISSFVVAANSQGAPLVFAITAVDKGNVIVNSVEVFAVVQDPANVTAYGQWVNLHLDTATTQKALSLAVTPTAAGGLTVCVLANDGHVYTTTFAPGSPPSSAAWQQPWTDIMQLSPSSVGMKSIALLGQQLVAVGTDNHVYTLGLTATGPTAWQSLGGITISTTQGTKTVTSAVVLNSVNLTVLANGDLQVVVDGSNSAGKALGAWSVSQATPNGAFRTT